MRFPACVLLAALATAAHAEERAFCASRPGLNTPPCTVEPGRIVVETGLVDWTREDDDDARTDTIIFADTLVRVGIDDRTEVQVGWTPYGQSRQRDKASGFVATARGTGDVTLALRRSLSGADGPVAIQPFVTVPVGGSAIGAGDWGAGVIVPIAFDLGSNVQLSFSPEIDAAVNASGAGRHLAFGSVAGVSAPLSKNLTGTVEVQALRDTDPAGTTTQMLASASLAWLLGSDTQLDIGVVAGLNRDSPDLEAYFGIARRF